MQHGHLHQGVGIAQLVVVEVLFEVSHQIQDGGVVLRGRVHYFAGLGIFEGGAGQPAVASVVVLRLGLNLDEVVAAQKAVLANQAKAQLQRGGVVLNFLRGLGGGAIGPDGCPE